MDTRLSPTEVLKIQAMQFSNQQARLDCMADLLASKRYAKYTEQVQQGAVGMFPHQTTLTKVINDLGYTGTLAIVDDEGETIPQCWLCENTEDGIELTLQCQVEAATSARLQAKLRAETESLLPPETVAKLKAEVDAGGHDTKSDQSKDIEDIEDIDQGDQGDQAGQGNDTQGQGDTATTATTHRLPLAPLLTKDSREFLRAIQSAYEQYVIALSFANKVGELPPEHAPLVLKTIADALSGNTNNHTGTDESTTAKHNLRVVTTAYKLLYTPASPIRKLKGSEASIIDKVSKL